MEPLPGSSGLSIFQTPLLRRTLAAAVLVLGLLGLAFRSRGFASDRLIANDFTQDYVAARASSEGLDPYVESATLFERYFGPADYSTFLPQGQRVPHPPALLTVFLPLAGRSYPVARTIWLLVSATSFAVAMGLFVRALGYRRTVAGIAAIGVIGLPIVQKELAYGQNNGLLLLLLVLGWLSLRRGSDALGGILIGVAAALKLFPAFLILPLILARRWRAASFMLGSAVVFSAMGSALVGFDETRSFVSDVVLSNQTYWRAAPMNLSLVAVPFRWLADNPWFPQALDAAAIARVGAGVLFAGCVALTARHRQWEQNTSMWLAVPWMLLASPLLWEFSLVLALPLVVGLVSSWFMGATRPSPLLAISCAIMAIGIPPGLPLPEDVGAIGQILGYALPTYAMVLLGLSAGEGFAGAVRGTQADPGRRGLRSGPHPSAAI